MRALGETVYRRLVLYERDLGEPASGRATPAEAVRYGFLSADQLDEYAVLRPGRRAHAAARLAAGDRCFATWLDGRLAAVRWLATGSPHVEYLDLRVPLAADEIYHYDTFTAPAVRRRGVSAASQDALASVLREEGYRWVVRAVLPENRAAIADAARAGYVACGRIGYVRIGTWRRGFVRWRRDLRA